MTQLSKPSARIILDSISPAGHRLTTMEVKMHRFVLAEFNTHRVFSRNSASSRAIPIEKRIQSVLDDPAMPLEWGSNQAGMQAGEQLPEQQRLNCIADWLVARNAAVDIVQKLASEGLHKQVANRLLEPFLWHTALVSSTEWDNFFEQRATPVCASCNGSRISEQCVTHNQVKCSYCDGTGFTKSLAQPEIVAVADAMRYALQHSVPQVREWHMPYVSDDPAIVIHETFTEAEAKAISVARCARNSYAHFDTNTANTGKDIIMFNKLKEATPPHTSPFEHVAHAQEPEMVHYQSVSKTPGCKAGGTMQLPTKGNFTGWIQYRHIVFGR